jgi:WD40 repeat protein
VAVMPSDPEHIEHTGMISALAFSPDTKILASASWDHSIRLWDTSWLGAGEQTNASRKPRTLQGHLNEVWSLAFSADGQTLVSGAKDGGVHLWTLREQAAEQLVPRGWVPLAFSPDGRRLASLNLTGVVAVFNLATREPERQVQFEWPRFGPPPPAPDSLGAPKPERAPGGPSGRPSGWGGRERRFMRLPTIALRSDLGVMAQGQDRGLVKLWDMETGEASFVKLGDGRVDLVGMSPSGTVLITGGRDQLLRWWEPHESTNALVNLDGHQVLFSPDSRRLAVFQRTNIVTVWDVRNRELLTNIVQESSPGPAAAFSPDARMLVTTSSMDEFDNAIYLWDAETGEMRGAFIGHKQPVWSVAFAPDGRTLASSSADGTVKFWNVKTRQELLSVLSAGNPVSGLLFSPDGRLLVGISGFGASETSLRVFRAASFDEIDRADPRSRGDARHRRM